MDAPFTAFSVPKHLENDFPFLEILPDNAGEVLLRNGEKVIAARKDNNVLLAHPCFDRAFLRSLLVTAGVHFYAPEGCTVYGDERFLFVIANEAVNGAVCFQKPVTAENVFSGEKFENRQEIPLNTEAKRGFLFRIL